MFVWHHRISNDDTDVSLAELPIDLKSSNVNWYDDLAIGNGAEKGDKKAYAINNLCEAWFNDSKIEQVLCENEKKTSSSE